MFSKRSLFSVLLLIVAISFAQAQTTRTPAEIEYKKGEKQLDYVKRVFTTGTRVVAMYPGSLFTSLGVVKAFTSKYRYLGTVTKLSPEKNGLIQMAYVVYDDGDQSWVYIANIYPYVPISSVSNTKDYVGKSVIARYYDSGSDASSWDKSYSRDSKFWYVGTINKVDGNRIYVVYKDGDTKWHTDFKTISIIPPSNPELSALFPYFGQF